MKKVLVKLSSVEMVKDFNSKLFPLEGEFDLGTAIILWMQGVLWVSSAWICLNL